MKKSIQLYSPFLTENGILIIEDVQKWEWIDKLKKITPKKLQQFKEVYDLRKN